MPTIPDYIVKEWNKGLINRVENESTPKGAASSSLNWITALDRIELRRGQAVMGVSIAGAGRVTGLKVAQLPDAASTNRVIHTVDRSIKYFDPSLSTPDWVEVGTNTLAAAASGEDIAIDVYNSLSGAFWYLSSPNSSIYKIAVANQDDVIDLQSKTFRGKIKIQGSTMYMWDRKDAFGGSDKTGLYRSWIDKDELADYAFVGKEDVGDGDGSNATETGTLTSINKATAANAKRTAMFVRIAGAIGAKKAISGITQASQAQVTATGHGLVVGDFVTVQEVVGMTEMNGEIATVTEVVDADNVKIDVASSGYTSYSSDGFIQKAEVFVDNKDGTLTGNSTGTGTINYTTGAFSITGPSAFTNSTNIYAEYYYEVSTDSDSGTSDSGAIADFTRSTPRDETEGFTIRQDDGGPFMNIVTLGDDDYCFHTQKTWRLSISPDDSTISNKPYKRRVGIPYWRAVDETADGVIYVDALDQSDPFVRRLKINDISGLADSKSISDNIKLSSYRFDYAVVREWGEYIMIACRTEDSAINDTLLVYNKLWESWDILDYRVSCMDVYEGALIAGDSGSKNVFTLFSGLTDEESEIPNQWTSGNDLLGNEGVKKVNRCVVAGNIGLDQNYDIQLSYDNGPFVTVKNISGRGDYVDKGQRVLIGPNTLGSQLIGGGGGGIEAFHYRYEFSINTDNFEKIRYRFVANAVGYVSVSEFQFKDIRYKGRRVATKYVQEPGAA